ncbi:MAG: SulP family inorganic anion transporter [Lachnospiraceae bacterium]|nr:SulP family inorganic anion transporter [Lachnospiraceae bacterium]
MPPRPGLNDIIGGIIIAMVSIPISMGYASVAGIPMQYGLIGSILPTLIYGLMTSTKNFIFGVDAAPAALVGSLLASMGISAGSEEAFETVGLITLLTAFWLLVFYIFRAGRITSYISMPVMGGFVTGICITIILMQIPKLYGADAQAGEAIEHIIHIVRTIRYANIPSLAIGIFTVVFLRVSAKLFPKIPMAPIMMVAGFIAVRFFHIDALGVKLLPAVESIPLGLHFPSLSSNHLLTVLFPSLTIAFVIMSETLLASQNSMRKSGHKMTQDMSNREVLAYALGNLSSCLMGCCPVNGSVSRSALSAQYGVKSQWVSVFSAITMVLVLLIATPMIAYLPVPVMTGIVFAALLGACDFDMAAELYKNCRAEFYIFLSAFLGVLIFGTVYGVVIGVILSFAVVIMKSVIPPKGPVGVIEGRDSFYSLDRYESARPIKNTVIYRFGGNLFFGNIDTFEQDILSAIKPDTHQVIIYAVGIGDIDVTAATRLADLYRTLKARGIKLYMTDHVGDINDELRRYGAGELLYGGCVRRSIRLALRDCGLHEPYPMEGSDNHLVSEKRSRTTRDELNTELEWIFGSESQDVLNALSVEVLRDLEAHVHSGSDVRGAVLYAEEHTSWGRIGLLDEEQLLNLVENSLMHHDSVDDKQKSAIMMAIEERRRNRREKLKTKLVRR